MKLAQASELPQFLSGNLFVGLPHDLLEYFLITTGIHYRDFMTLLLSSKALLEKCLARKQALIKRQLLLDFEVDPDLIDEMGRKVSSYPQEMQDAIKRPDPLVLYSLLLKTLFKPTGKFQKKQATILLIDGPFKTSLADSAELGRVGFSDLDEAYVDSFKRTELRVEKKYPNFRLFLRRGDLIEDVSESGYRSQGTYFWDGETIIDLNRALDGYGTVSQQFVFFNESSGNERFTNPRHWDTLNVVPLIPQPWGIKVKNMSKFYWHHSEATFLLDPWVIYETLQKKQITFYSGAVTGFSAETIPDNMVSYYVLVNFKGVQYKVSVTGTDIKNHWREMEKSAKKGWDCPKLYVSAMHAHPNHLIVQ